MLGQRVFETYRCKPFGLAEPKRWLRRVKVSDVTAICSRVRREVRHRLRDRLPRTSYRNQRRERLVDLNQFVGRFGMSRSSQVGGLSPQHEVADPKPRHSPCWGFILHDLVRGVRVVVPCADWTINRTGS